MKKKSQKNTVLKSEKVNIKGKGKPFSLHVFPAEVEYIEKMKKRNHISGGTVFHLALAEYMRRYPL